MVKPGTLYILGILLTSDTGLTASGIIAISVLYTLLIAVIVYVILYRRFRLKLNKLETDKKETDSLLDERKLLRALIDSIPDFIYVKDVNSKFAVANKRLAEVLKVKSPKELIGKTDHEFYPKELADSFYRDEQEIIRTGVPVINKDEIGMDEEQNSRYLSTSKVPFRNELGQIVGIIGIGRDITKQKLTELKIQEQADNLQEINSLLEERQSKIEQQSEQIKAEKDRLLKEHSQLRILIDSMPDYIYFKNNKTEFVTANKKILDALKIPSLENIVGKTDANFYSKELAEQYYNDDMSVINSGEPIINKKERVYNERDGERVLLTTKIPLTDEKGEVFGLVGIGRDITEIKETEEKLQKQAEELKEVNVLLEERQEEIIQQTEELKNQKDIVEQKHEQLRTLIDVLPDYIYFKDNEARFITVNDTLVRVMKAGSIENVIGKNDFDFYKPDQAQLYYNDDMEVLKKGKAIVNKEEHGIDEEGNDFFMSTTKIPLKREDGTVFGLVGIGRNISEIKQAALELQKQKDELQELNVILEERQEEIVQQSEELKNQNDIVEQKHQQLRQLIDSLPDYIYFKDTEARFITVNATLAKVMKIGDVENVVGKTDFDLNEPEQAQLYYNDDMDVLKKGNPILNKEERGLDEEGNVLYMSTTKIPLKRDDGTVFGLVGIGRNITELKKATIDLEKQKDELQELNVLLEERQEEVIQQSEEITFQKEFLEQKHKELRTLIDSMPDYIYFKDAEARFVTANDILVKVMKAGSIENMVGKTDFDFYPPEVAQKYFDDDMEVVRSGKPIIGKEEKGFDEAGNELYMSTTKIPLLKEDGKAFGLVGIGRNITEVKKASINLQKQKDELQELNVLLEERQEEVVQQSEEISYQRDILEQKHSELRALIDAMPDYIYFKDAEARFVTANEILVKVMKSGSIENMIGKTDFDFYPTEIAQKYFDDDMTVIKKGTAIINKEEKGLDEEGNDMFLSTTKIPLKREDGKVFGLVGIGRNITELKQAQNKLIEQAEYLKEVNVLLEERQEEIYQQSEELSSQAEHLREVNLELEKLSIVASKTDNSVAIIRADGLIEFVNDGFCRIYQFKDTDLIDKNCFTDLNKYFSDSFLKNFKDCISKNKAITYESLPINKRGDKLFMQTTLTPIVDEGVVAKVILVESDVSTIKEAELKIEKQRDELKTLNSTKDKFFSIIAHDLKNPFHAIIGFTDFLTQNFPRVKDVEKQRILDLINSTSRSTFNLLENLLNWARTQTNAIKFNPRVFNIFEVINENIKLLQISANKKNITINNKIPELELVFADINMINTVVRNILTNALKFTNEGGDVTINAKIQDKMIEISISDTGVGIDKETLDGLFSLDDYKTSIGTSGETGTGLGLIICQEFLKKNNGTISAKSDLGKGTTFFFTIPRSE